MGLKAVALPGDHDHDEVWSPGPPAHQGHAHLRPSKLKNFGGGGLVRAQTTVRQTPFPWQPCPGRQPPAGSEIPLERIATVGLMPFHHLHVLHG